VFESYLRNSENISLTAKELQIDFSSARYHINKILTDPDQATFIRNCYEAKIEPSSVSHYWLKSKDVSMFVKHSTNTPSFEEIREKLVTELQNYAPKYTPIRRQKGQHLLVIDPADIHVGKLTRVPETATGYDIDKAVGQVREGVNGLLAKASGFALERILLVIGNDVLHTDNTKRTSTHGTPQDTDGMWWEAFIAAKRMYVAIIEQLRAVAPVHLVFCPSNHDYMSGFMLAEVLTAWFRNCTDVTADASISHRKYFKFGSNLLGFTHGDGAKKLNLPQLMQHEVRDLWGQTKWGYWYTHHTHHKEAVAYGSSKGMTKLEKDQIGVTILDLGHNLDPDHNVTIETVRSPSPADSWHAKKGYVNGQAVEAFIHHPEQGQVARLTHWFS
jgi:hypothetical protein